MSDVQEVTDARHVEPRPAPDANGRDGPVVAPDANGRDGPVVAPDANGRDGPVVAPDANGRDGPVVAPDVDGRDGPVVAPDVDGGDGFVAAFDAFSQAIRRARGAGSDHPGGLTVSQYALLRTLADRDGARVSDLAGQAAVTPSTATRILDALERRAIVCRTRSVHDRRGVTVTLTDAGRAALQRQDAWMQGRQRAFWAQLPEPERALAPDLLLRMSALIDELAAGPQD